MCSYPYVCIWLTIISLWSPNSRPEINYSNVYNFMLAACIFCAVLLSLLRVSYDEFLCAAVYSCAKKSE